jgi:hypothetical protein
LLAGFYSRHAPIIIAETDELKMMLVRQRGIAPDKRCGRAGDHSFYPKDQAAARKSLGISSAVTVLLHVGGMINIMI